MFAAQSNAHDRVGYKPLRIAFLRKVLIMDLRHRESHEQKCEKIVENFSGMLHASTRNHQPREGFQTRS